METPRTSARYRASSTSFALSGRTIPITSFTFRIPPRGWRAARGYSTTGRKGRQDLWTRGQERPRRDDTRLKAVSKSTPSRARHAGRALRKGLAHMARFRQDNVAAAQWSPNGGALGTVDLTQ